jgi:hypothetical protein
MVPGKIVTETSTGLLYYEQGEVRFPVDTTQVGTFNTFDKLNSGIWAQLAKENEIPADPFDRKLLKTLLMGVVQLVWFRDVEKRDENQMIEVTKTQQSRLETYLKRLKDLKENPDRVPGEKRASTASKPRASKQYKLNPEAKATWEKFGGQKKIIIDAMLKFEGGATCNTIADAIKSQLTTKQPAERVVAFYMNDFGHKKIVLVVGEQAEIETAPPAEAAPKQEPEAAAAVAEIPAKTTGKKGKKK